MEFDVFIFLPLKGLSLVEFIIVDLLEGGLPQGSEIEIIPVEPGIKILAVVLGPDFLSHPGFV